MLKCIAIDDEPLALRQISAYIAKIPYLELAATFNNAIEAQQRLASERVDLIFVDINMPDLNGVDFVRALTDRPMVVFTTAYSEYAIDGFKLDAVDYLLKPFSFADFSRAAAKANSLYELRQGRLPAQPDSDSEATPKTANTSPSRPTTRSRSSVSPTLSISKAKGSTCGCISATDRPSPRSSA